MNTDQYTSTKRIVRCKILGPSLVPGYMDSEISIAWHDGSLFLRIGNDVYEGKKAKKSGLGTAVHFSVEAAELLGGGPRGAAVDASSQEDHATTNLTNFALSDEEYCFWPAGPFAPETQSNQPWPISVAGPSATQAHSRADTLETIFTPETFQTAQMDTS